MTDKNLEKILGVNDTVEETVCDELGFANSSYKEGKTRGFLLAKEYITLMEEGSLMDRMAFSRKYFNENSEDNLTGYARESFNSKVRGYYALKFDCGDYSA